MMKLSNINKVSIVLMALLAMVPFQGFVYDLFMMKIFCFAILAASLNLLLGFAGLLSFGHAAFFGTGAYITAHVMKEWGVTPEFGLFCGLGLPGIRNERRCGFLPHSQRLHASC